MFPKGKTKIKIKSYGLPELENNSNGTFEFVFSKKQDEINLSIPGTPRGYDLIIPSSKEQEAWLRKVEKKFKKGFKEVWYCLWQLDNEEVLEKFLDFIRPNIIEEKYL